MIWNPFKKKKQPVTRDDEAFEKLWDDRLKGLESLYGKSDDMVGHAVVPFHLGADVGGAADIVYFKNHVPGCLAVTAELIGCEDQKRNSLGNYELAVAHRSDDEPWGANLISRLAYYTLDAVLKPGETMDIGPAAPEGSTVDAVLFYDYGRFAVGGQECGVLLCVGITEQEKQACFAGKTKALLKALEERGVHPYTDLVRDSVI